jgi:hypothetical protein
MKLPSLILAAVLLLTAGANAKNAKNNRPAGPAPITQEEKEELKKNLSGTFWTYGDGKAEKDWYCLNADGTATAGWHDLAGSWRIIGSFTIELKITGHSIQGASPPYIVIFDPALTQGGGTRRINPPTQAMLNRVAAKSGAGATASSAAATPAPGGNYFGTNATGSAPTPVPEAVAAITNELQTQTATIVKANHNNLVFVTGKEGEGSGFIASMGGKNYLVTNAHVAAGISGAAFKALDGTAVQGGVATVAVGEDIFRMEMPAGGKPLEAMTGVDENAGIGDDVVVLGNAEGAGVINTITGKIVGIGPNLVEINAAFVPGNSGSPIIHIKSGKVIGVATYTVTQSYDATTKQKMKAPVVRRFGYRLDSVKTWQPVNWQTFYAQAAEMRNIETLTNDLGDFFRDLAEHKGRVTPGRHTNPVIKTRIDQWLGSKTPHMSVSDWNWQNANFISFLKVACQSDVTMAARRMTYDYFQRDLADETATRNEMAKAFEELIKENGQ